MNSSNLNLSKLSALFFKDFVETSQNFDNLFVLTHLGQLKQMEALITSRKIVNNCLVVLYTRKNLVVPMNVHDQYSDVFSKAIFLEIPPGINKIDFQKLKTLEKSYIKLIRLVAPKNIFLNSFEGHYAILTSLAKQQAITTNLVEEGTATYKFNLKKMEQNEGEETLTYEFVRDKFMSTVGQTQIFKRLVKIQKYNKDLYKQSKRFINDVTKDERFQKKLIKLSQDPHLKASLEPFKDFDKAYASFPNLIKESFGTKDVDYFLIHEIVDEKAVADSKRVIEQYDIKSSDVLYVSQRYHLNPEEYARAVTAILSRITHPDQTVFIKLHPKENKKTYDTFKYFEFASNNKFVVIEESQFLIESVIKESRINKLIGLTSTTLVYGPLVSENTASLSIAEELIKILPHNAKNSIGIKTIKEHLEIIKIFDNIEII